MNYFSVGLHYLLVLQMQALIHYHLKQWQRSKSLTTGVWLENESELEFTLYIHAHIQRIQTARFSSKKNSQVTNLEQTYNFRV